MKNIIFFSDIDRTIIHSMKFLNESNNPEIIEYNNSKPISYIEKESLLLLNDLSKKLLLIPVTTRSLNQYKRIKFPCKFKYSIISNGGIILKNGKRLKQWDKLIKRKINKTDYIEIKNNLNRINKYLIKEINLIDDVFYFSKVKENYINDLMSELDNILIDYNWDYTIQSNKLYIIPNFISKENAIKYLLKTEIKGNNFIITAGDGKLDYNFVFFKEANLKFVPKNSEIFKLAKNKKFNSIDYNSIGTLNMLSYIENNIVNK